MQFTAAQIAQLLQGTVEGDPNATVSKLSKIEEGGAGSLSFLANPAYTQYVYETTASVVIIGAAFELVGPVKTTLVRVADAQGAFAKVLELYNTIKLDKKGVSPKAAIEEGAAYGNDCYIGPLAYIGANAKLGNNVKVYPHAYIGDNVVIGDNTTVFANVTIYSDCVVGARCIIHSGTVIGSDGFRFATGPGGGAKIPQIGNVVIEDDVEIGANCAIDRATLGSTILRKRSQVRQPHTHRPQRGGRREHVLRGRGGGGGFHQDRQELHVQRAGGHHRSLEDCRRNHHRGAERHQQRHQGGRGLHGLTGLRGAEVPQELHPLPEPGKAR